MKATAQTVIIWLFLVFVAGSCFYKYIQEQATSRRLLYDLKAAVEVAEDFRTLEGHQASKLIAQELTIKELKTVNPQLMAQFKNLYIAPRLVNSYTQSEQTFQAEISAPVTDSIRNLEPEARSQKPETIKIFSYRDKWIKVSGTITDTARIKLAAIDTIFTAIYKGDRRRPWLWVLSKRQYTAAATNRSPYIKIKVIQSGIIKK